MNKEPLDPAKAERAVRAFAAVPFAKLLGMELGEIQSGVASIHLTVRDELKQNQGVVHGGAIASLMDTAAAVALLTLIEVHERVTTTDLTIHYLRPITTGRMSATARVVRRGQRVMVLNIEVTNEQGRTIATAVTGYIKLQ